MRAGAPAYVTLARPSAGSYNVGMFVEGSLRWQVTEDCPWDLLMALALRDLGGLTEVGDPVLPRLSPAVIPALHRTRGRTALGTTSRAPAPATAEAPADRRALEQQWSAWFEVAADRLRRPATSLLHPPHFEAFDRAIELQDLVIEYYDDAAAWARERHAEYARASLERHARRAADIVEVVHNREHELRRQAGYFRLDLYVLPLAESGAWIVGPHTVVVSASLRDDTAAFREWFTPVVDVLV